MTWDPERLEALLLSESARSRFNGQSWADEVPRLVREAQAPGAFGDPNWLVRASFLLPKVTVRWDVDRAAVAKGHGRAPDRPFEDVLMEEDGLVDELVWGFFEVTCSEPDIAVSFGERTRRGVFWGPWAEALSAMLDQGAVDRARLLEAVLSVLGRDNSWHHFRALHKALRPTGAEVKAHKNAYLGLLATQGNSDLGLRMATSIAKGGDLSATEARQHLLRFVAGKKKGLAKRALKLLGVAGKARPAEGAALAVLAAEALVSAHADIQEAALDVIEAVAPAGEPEVAAALKESLELLASSVRARAETLAGADQPAAADAVDLQPLIAVAGRLDPAAAALAGLPELLQSEAEPVRARVQSLVGAGQPAQVEDLDLAPLIAEAQRLPPAAAALTGLPALRESEGELPRVVFTRMSIPVLGEPLEPIADLETLIARASRVIEKPEDMDEIELVLDGISRLCAERPADFDRQVGSLKNRVLEYFPHGTILGGDGGAPCDLHGVIRAWTTGEASHQCWAHWARPNLVGDLGVAAAIHFWGTSDRFGWHPPTRPHIGLFITERFVDVAKRVAMNSGQEILRRHPFAGPQKSPVDGVTPVPAFEGEGGDQLGAQRARLLHAFDRRRRFLHHAHRADRRLHLQGSEPGRFSGLLSTPSHRGGWIAAATLVERARQTPEVELHDGVQALLRLAPDGREAALSAAGDLEGVFGAALREALGGAPAEALAEPYRAALDALAEAQQVRREPIVVPPREMRRVYLYRDGGVKTRSEICLRLEPTSLQGAEEPACPARLFRNGIGLEGSPETGMDLYRHCSEDIGLVRSGPWVWPQDLEPFFACGVERLGTNMAGRFKHWGDRGFLEPLLDPDVPLGEWGMTVLAIGLGHAERTFRGLATDALIAGVEDGRVSGSALGERMAWLFDTGLDEEGMKRAVGERYYAWLKDYRLPLKLALGSSKRWAACLADAAEVSPLHRHVVRHAVERSLRGRIPEPPPGMQALLGVLCEACSADGAGVVDPDLRAELGQMKGRSKGAALGRKLAALETVGDGGRQRALALALEGRIKRAQRYAERLQRAPE